MNNMNQKTFITENPVSVGDLVILFERSNINSGSSKWDCIPWGGEGIEGNLNPHIKRYHGWRGTTNNVSIDAYGLRKVKKVIPMYYDFDYDIHYLDTKTDITDVYIYVWKVTVGKDLHPEWD